jgi:ppGpp synthetase/RelA/SpoT-type nucleotidyltranferase
VTEKACPSISQVNKAGRVLRKWRQAGGVASTPAQIEAIEAAFEVLLAFRAAHSAPLAKATMGLRSMVSSEGCRVEVTQRLKRSSTILDKLGREPTMQLANMQDIGGSRAVLDTIDELRRVERRLRKRRPPRRVSDYIEEPKVSGYRGVHVIVDYDGRAIEVQLRTPTMHAWAITVERLSGRRREDIKSGRGPQELLDLLETISRAMALEEVGQVVEQDLLDQLSARRLAAVPYLTEGQT